ncbi:MAG: CHY zinc finger protein [bacterium]|nr:CHY zinc finger protein [bacterium]
MRIVHGCEVYGVEVYEETRCRHWNSPLDIIAIKFKCCDRWYPCFDCHSALTDHQATVWPRHEFYYPAILCGACGHQLSIKEYQNAHNSCPSCSAAFNPGCGNHYHLYFEVPIRVD